MREVEFAVQQQRAHEAIRAEVPRAFDHIAFGEGVAHELSRGPIQRKARVAHERVPPVERQEVMQRDEKADQQREFRAHRPHG